MENNTNGLLYAHSEADIVVFSHLRWHFVFQRPQHIISGLAKNRKVFFVEEPVGFDENNRGTAEIMQVQPNVTVLQPHIDPANLVEELAPVVQSHLVLQGNGMPPVLWFYSAAFHEMIEKINHSLVIYDCMDELSAFKGAPPALIQQEKELLKKADIVFTGGRSLYEAKSLLCDRVFCYPSSVDAAHFQKSLLDETIIPEDIRDISHPIASYYGVIDERMDIGLLDELAEQNPEISFVMIGPVVKISEDDLPRRSNIYFLGMKPYDALPAYLKAVDIAIMPFALNEATAFISPTKTLEYIAAQKPIVSTPIKDVVREYSHIVSIAQSSGEFSLALRTCLQENGEAKRERLKKYEGILSAVSWDKTVDNMKLNIENALLTKNEFNHAQQV